MDIRNWAADEGRLLVKSYRRDALMRNPIGVWCRPVRSWGLLVGLSLAAAACGETLDTELLAEVERVRAAVEAPGAIVGVRAVDGATELYATGTADLSTGRPVMPGDHFYLGSISKMFTAVATMQLVERDVVRLDDALARFVPEFPNADRVSVRQLLNQTSGLKDFVAYLYYRPDRGEMLEMLTRPWTIPEMIELAGRFEPWFQPGERWDYSNTNYFLLGVVIQRATGRSLADVLREGIFHPLNLTDTWLDGYEPSRGAVEVTGYLGSVPSWPHSEMFGDLGATRFMDTTRVEFGAGGVVSTAAESLTFLLELFGRRGGRLLRPESFETMQQFVPAAALGVTDGVEGDGPAYGFGVMRETRSGYSTLGHGGIFNGYTAGLFYFPECRIGVAAFLNRGFVPMRRMLDAVASQRCRAESDS